MIWVIGRSQDPAGPPVDVLYYQTRPNIRTQGNFRARDCDFRRLKRRRRETISADRSIGEMSGHRGFRLDDEVAGLKCVCAASLTASRILIGEHSSEPMRAAAAPAMCITPVTAPPRGVAQCVDTQSDGVQVSEATAMLAPSGWAFIAERPRLLRTPAGLPVTVLGMGMGPEIASLAQSLQWSR